MSTSQPGRALPFPFALPKDDEAPSREHAHTSDEQLIQRVRVDDPSALQILFQRYARLVLKICLRILHDYGEAEETVQDVFLYVHQKAEMFDESKGTAKGWITQVAYHRSLDRLKFLKRRGFYLGTEIVSVVETVKGETDLDRMLDAELSRARLEKAFRELPEPQRKTLELFYFEGLELREIAEQLHEPLGNVRHWYYRGLKKLRMSSIVQKMRDDEI